MTASLLIILPILLLSVSSLAILALGRIWPGFGFSWLVAFIGALAAWSVMLVLRFRLPTELELAIWSPTELFGSSPALRMDQVSWPYAFSLVTLCVAVILTATARYHQQTSPNAWAGSLGLTALGLAAVQAANPLTLLLAWTAVDLVELVILISSLSTDRSSTRPVIAFAARVAGTILVLWALVVHRGSELLPEFSLLPSPLGLFLLLGVAFRLGVLPLHLPFAQEPPLRRGLGNVLRLVPVATGLVVLARLSPGAIPPAWVPALLILTALPAIYGSLLWLTATDELKARPFWIISVAALSIACILRNQPFGSISWGIVLILPGSFLFLFSARERKLLFLVLLALWGLSGLPFSPNASGWQGLVGRPLPGVSVVYFVAVFFLFMGYLRHALRREEGLAGMERWVLLTYPLGLVLLVLAHILLGLYGWSGSRTIGIWWVSGFFLILTCLAAYWYWQKVWMQPDGDRYSTRHRTLRLISSFDHLENALSFDWFYRLLWAGYRGLGRLIAGVTTILEGDGGVLWVLLLLTLLLSLLRTEGFQ